MSAEERTAGEASSDRRLPFSRWWLIVVAALVMGFAGTYQFLWSSIRGPLSTQIDASGTTLGTLFTLLIAMQTLSQFPAGWIRDRYGPRVPMLVGALCLSAGYAGLAVASTPVTAGIAVVIGGIGAGSVYTVAVNTPVKWFDDRRGLATGVVTMAYGGLSVAFIPLIRSGASSSLSTALMIVAGVVGAVSLIGVVILRDPGGFSALARGSTGGPNDRTAQERPSYTWRQTVRTWQFWVLYGVFVIVNGVGLMLIGKVIDFADNLGLSAGAATAAASMVALAEGGGVLAGGAVSDRLGQVRTVGTALILSGFGIAGATLLGAVGLGTVFVGFVGIAAFFRSPVFSVFPSLIGSYYGTAHSSENYALLYSAKIWGSVLGGTVTSLLIAAIGWRESFLIAALLMGVAGAMTLTIRPVRASAV